MKKIITSSVALIISMAFIHAQERVHSSGKDGYNILRKDEKGLTVNYSIGQLAFSERVVNGEPMKELSVPGMFLPNEAGYPDLPGNGRLIAVPQGATAVIKNVSYETETIKNIAIAPAPVIPLVTDVNPTVYEKNVDAYSKNALFPESPVKLFDPKQIRGIDVVMLGITPFQ